jgi:proline iminopeptidase
MTILATDGAELFYQIVGKGEPCLVLHGGPGIDHTSLRPWLDPLGEHAQLVFLDQRGNGRSTMRPGEIPDFKQLCADADALRTAVGAERVALLGHSFGGFVALEYALRYPERVRHLILVDSAPSFDYGEEIKENIARRELSEETLAAVSAPPPSSDAEFGAMWRAVLPLYFHHYDASLAKQTFAETVYRAAAAAWGSALFASYNVVTRLGAINAPTLVVVGEDDLICPPRQARRLQAGISGAQLVPIPGCGHFPFVERPDEFLAVVRRWLIQHGARGRRAGAQAGVAV